MHAEECPVNDGFEPWTTLTHLLYGREGPTAISLISSFVLMGCVRSLRDLPPRISHSYSHWTAYPSGSIFFFDHSDPVVACHA